MFSLNALISVLILGKSRSKNLLSEKRISHNNETTLSVLCISTHTEVKFWLSLASLTPNSLPHACRCVGRNYAGENSCDLQQLVNPQPGSVTSPDMVKPSWHLSHWPCFVIGNTGPNLGRCNPWLALHACVQFADTKHKVSVTHSSQQAHIWVLLNDHALSDSYGNFHINNKASCNISSLEVYAFISLILWSLVV